MKENTMKVNSTLELQFTNKHYYLLKLVKIILI